MGHPQAAGAGAAGVKPAFQIPVSAGIPTGVRLSFVGCVLLVLIILGCVIISSSANHVWPSGNSLNVPL